jgi:hypothetical protein
VFSKIPAEEQKAALDAAIDGVNALFKAASGGGRAGVEHEIAERGPLASKRATKKLPKRVTVNLVRCPRCADGHLAATLIEQKKNNLRATHLGSLPLAQERVCALFG